MRENGDDARWSGCAPIAFMALGMACTTDTTGLERRDPELPLQGGAGGMVVEAGGMATGAAGVEQADVAGPPAEGGSGAISILNGIVDGGRLFLCVSDITTARVLRTELPAPGGGLGFGEVYRLAADWDLASQAVEAALFAATPGQIEGLGCAELMAAAAAPRGPAPGSMTMDAGLADAGGGGVVVPFPTEPLLPRRAGSVTFAPGALRASGQYVLVTAGCATPGVRPSEEICGLADPLSGAHQRLVLTEFGSATSVEGETRFGLQFLNASRAVGRADLVLQGASQRQPVLLANDVEFGALRPRLVAIVDEPAGLELHIDGGEGSDYIQSWPDTLSWNRVDATAVGRNYLVVYVGPVPSVAADLGFAAPRFALIPATE